MHSCWMLGPYLKINLKKSNKCPWCPELDLWQTLQSVATPFDFGSFRVVRPYTHGHELMLMLTFMQYFSLGQHFWLVFFFLIQKIDEKAPQIFSYVSISGIKRVMWYLVEKTYSPIHCS